MNRLPLYALLAGLLVASSPASAAILLDLVNVEAESQVAYVLAFTATNSETTIVFGGYHVPSYLQATQISVTADGTTANLLHRVWDHRAAPIGSLANQTSGLGGYSTGTNPLEFGSTHVAAYDLFAQTFATTVGSVYNVNFLFSQDYGHNKNGFKITTDETLAMVASQSAPEPSTWAMMIAGFGFVGFALRYRQKNLSHHSFRA